MAYRFALTVIVFIGCMLGGSAGAYAEIIWHVDDNAAGDPQPGDPAVSDPLEDGSAEHPFDAIQEGIDAAGGRDTVLVAAGWYTGIGNRDLNFGGKSITLQSEGGPDTCIIDGQGMGRGFVFESGETAGAVVDGFTIQNGSAVWESPWNGVGAGIYCGTSSPTIKECVLRWNEAEQDGGGIYCNWGSLPTITDCTMTGNLVGYYGGGIACYNGSNVIMVNCTISENLGIAGSGMASFSSHPKLTGCVFTDNASSGAG